MTTEEIKDAVKDALNEELGNFYIAREIHYKDHQFVGELREWTGEIKSTAIKTFTRGLIVIFFGLVLLGFGFWMKGQIK